MSDCFRASLSPGDYDYKGRISAAQPVYKRRSNESRQERTVNIPIPVGFLLQLSRALTARYPNLYPTFGDLGMV